MNKIKPNYYAVIPANVRYDTNLPPRAVLLYGEISALCNEKGYCWASNSYFSELYGVSKNTITNLVKSLNQNGHITMEIKYKVGSKEILGRYIKIVGGPTQNNIGSPTQKNCGDNTTSINTTINNKYNNDVIASYKKCLNYFPIELQPKNDKSKLEWIDTIEKLNRIDKHSLHTIELVIKSTRQNDFWSKNFLSIAKLRKKNKEKLQYFVVFLQQIDNKLENSNKYSKWQGQ